MCYTISRVARVPKRFLFSYRNEYNQIRAIERRHSSDFKRFGFSAVGHRSLIKSAGAFAGLCCGAYLVHRWNWPGAGGGEDGQSKGWRWYSLLAKQQKETVNKCTDDSLPLDRRPRVLSDTDAAKLHLTLYQYQVCPFCCKVRAYLDYYGVPYTIKEVDPVFRKEIKFSQYRKVPILIQKVPGQEDVQMNDSSVIISALTSFMVTDEKDLGRITTYFPRMTYKDEGGKEVSEYANRYNIMLGTPGLKKSEKAEMKWRAWVDGVLVHNLPPNIYRSPSEALQAFSYISSKGNFNSYQKFIIKYTGAAGMFVVAKKLKRKYNIKDDVRQSLYDAANEWMAAVGKQDFMGGSKPNLADLSAYGVLSSIEGLDAFNDMCRETKIGPWYYRTKQAVESHAGAC